MEIGKKGKLPLSVLFSYFGSEGEKGNGKDNCEGGGDE